jgi:hypothetical protein
MRLQLIGLALMLATASALAQQPPPPSDPQIMIYRQLLDQANSQLVSVAAQLQTANARITALEDKANTKATALEKPSPPGN